MHSDVRMSAPWPVRPGPTVEELLEQADDVCRELVLTQTTFPTTPVGVKGMRYVWHDGERYLVRVSHDPVSI